MVSSLFLSYMEKLLKFRIKNKEKKTCYDIHTCIFSQHYAYLSLSGRALKLILKRNCQ